jgi:tetratricopeptide (TPR) repeat protein
MKSFREDISKADALFQAGKLDASRILFEKIVQTDSNHYEALNNLGTIHYLQGHIPDAEKYYLTAFSLKEDDADTLANLSDLYLHLKRWDEAARFLERYLCQTPGDYMKMNQFALALMESGNPTQAIPVIEKSLEIQPNQEDLSNILKTLRDPHPVKSVSTQRRDIPRVSVGLPVYNGGSLLPQAIESILAQDFEDFELIISDNASNDQTQDVCRHYQKMDSRIRYYRFDENLGALSNFLNAFGMATAPFFMWAADDDLRDKTFISACLVPLDEDPSVALVYPRTKILDANSKFLGIAQDHLDAGQETSQERFTHLIWEIGMCNAFYGIYRSAILKRISSWGKTLFGDNLMLAEITLMGKIIQIDAPVFIRRLTRDYQYHSEEERNTQLMSDVDPRLFLEGISFPHCRLAYGHLELVNQSGLRDAEKDALMAEVVRCFRTRFGPKMTYEIDRAVALITDGHFFHQWNQADHGKDASSEGVVFSSFHISALLKRLQEALYFYPEREDLTAAYDACMKALSKTMGSFTGV